MSPLAKLYSWLMARRRARLYQWMKDQTVNTPPAMCVIVTYHRQWPDHRKP